MSELADSKDDDLEDRGLVGHSYDGFFKIDKRLRKIEGMHLPGRSGVSVTQIQTFALVFVVWFFVFVLLIDPILELIGISVTGFVFLGVLIAPPALCSWRVIRPMPFGKSIPSTIRSILMYYLDDKEHARGRPVKTPRRPDDEYVLHYQRDWAVAQEFAPEVAGEGDWTDYSTEAFRTSGQENVQLQEWMDEKAVVNYRKATASKKAVATEQIKAHNPRGQIATAADF